MRKPAMKRILLWITATAVILALIALVIPQRRLSVTILNPKFHLLSAKLSYGKTQQLARANWPIT